MLIDDIIDFCDRKYTTYENKCGCGNCSHPSRTLKRMSSINASRIADAMSGGDDSGRTIVATASDQLVDGVNNFSRRGVKLPFLTSCTHTKHKSVVKRLKSVFVIR